MSQAEPPREDQSKQLLTKVGVLTDTALAVVFFLVFTFVVIPPHVPGHDTGLLYLYSAYTSFCLSMVFWMALGLFRVTLVDHKKRLPAKSDTPAS
ncbi:MAG: hypothetical protein ACFBZ8_00655 [Opitutales bacterium]